MGSGDQLAGSRDLSNPDDRYILRIEVAHAARSSDDTSRRIKRRNEVYRELGRTTGGRPGFGFPRRDQAWKPGPGESEQDRPNVPAARVEAERRALREAVDDLLAGLTSQSAGGARVERCGPSHVEGVAWESPSVRNTLMRPTLAGRIESSGELIGRMPGEPLIEERKWLQLRAIVEGRRRGRSSTNRYLSSGIIRFGRCGKQMGADVSFMGEGITNRSIYRCKRQRGGCGLTIDLDGADKELRALTIALLSDPRHAQAISAARARVSDRLAELNTEIREIEQLQSALSERVGRREMKYADFTKVLRLLAARS